MERLSQLSKQLQSNENGQVTAKSQDDVVICGAVRTPLTKAKRGGLKDTPAEVLLSTVLKALVERAKVDPKLIQDIVVGNVNQPGSGVISSRMAGFLAGFPETTSLMAVNRLCSSGLEACSIIASKIRSGTIDIGIGSGVEQMTMFDMQSAMNPELLSEQVFEHSTARDCLLPMGQTSENVAEQFGVLRENQDRFAVQSHIKASNAQEQGLFDSEIVPVQTFIKNGDKVQEITVSKDDGIRKETTFEGLQKLKAAFKKDGTTTAGNASQVTDGAAAVLLARRSHAEKLGLPILARFVDYVVAGVPPNVMGIGPAVAIPILLNRNGLTPKSIDIYELNEAFASQALYSIEKVGIDINRVNPKGGAIALGHPLGLIKQLNIKNQGCTGARQIATLLPELKRQNAKLAVVSMCIGTGMGAAALIQNEQ